MTTASAPESGILYYPWEVDEHGEACWWQPR